ncbi:conserved membrane hypothetical protein [Verrucomicrobia bacterium]|nr:conserved membrane hypothetical protein [Verrucomicrobiota bacterium]
MKQYKFVDYATQGYCLLVGALILLFHNATVPAWPWFVLAHVACLFLTHALIQAGARWRASRVLDFLRHFYPMFLYIGFFRETGWVNRMFFSDYLDPKVIAFEQRLFGCQPSVLLMQKLPWLGLSELFYAAYFSYYLMIGGVALALFLRNRAQFRHYVSVISFLFYVCYLTYIVFPVIGPPVFFSSFNGYELPAQVQQLAPVHVYPEALKSGLFYRLMAWIYGGFESPGAAVPSSHVAVALGTVFFSFRYLRPIRYYHLVVVIILCLSTAYCRYHYGVDVLSGVLTAAVLVPLGNWLYFRSLSRLSADAPSTVLAAQAKPE